jgi:hypothetical protein
LINFDNKPLNLIIGDSIVKEANSWQFDVYRKDENNVNYKFYKNYDLDNLLKVMGKEK